MQAVFNLAMLIFPIITIPLPCTMHNNICVASIDPCADIEGCGGEPHPFFENSKVLNLHYDRKITENMP